jgi:hypothetical protein
MNANGVLKIGDVRMHVIANALRSDGLVDH